MNIFEQEDLIKGLPDQALMKEAQQPSGQLPQYLVVSEIQRRQDMRKRFSAENQETPQDTIKDQILSGIAAMGDQQPQQQQPPQPGGMPPQPGGMPPQPGGMPPGAMPPQPGGMPPGGMPPMGMPPQQPMPMPPGPQGPMPPQGMAAGGVVRMQSGRQATYPPGAVPQSTSIIGQRINNPLNVRQYGQGFEGDVGEEDSFIKFEDPRYGVRAADKVLGTYGRDYGIDTIEDVISRYAPPSDDNPTQEYIDFVSRQAGIGPSEEIDLQDPELRARLLSPMAMLESRTEISPQEVLAQIASLREKSPELNINPNAPALAYTPDPVPDDNPYKDARRREQLVNMASGNRGLPNAVKADAEKADPQSIVGDRSFNELINSVVPELSTSLPQINLPIESVDFGQNQTAASPTRIPETVVKGKRDVGNLDDLLRETFPDLAGAGAPDQDAYVFGPEYSNYSAPSINPEMQIINPPSDLRIQGPRPQPLQQPPVSDMQIPETVVTGKRDNRSLDELLRQINPALADQEVKREGLPVDPANVIGEFRDAGIREPRPAMSAENLKQFGLIEHGRPDSRQGIEGLIDKVLRYAEERPQREPVLIPALRNLKDSGTGNITPYLGDKDTWLPSDAPDQVAIESVEKANQQDKEPVTQQPPASVAKELKPTPTKEIGSESRNLEPIARKPKGLLAGIKEGISGMDDAAALALMQLGKGIAEGDVAGGIAKAGEAALKQRQSEKLLDLREKLTSAQAARYEALASTTPLEVLDAVNDQIANLDPRARLEIVEKHGSIDNYREVLIRRYAEAAKVPLSDMASVVTMSGDRGGGGNAVKNFMDLDLQ